MVKRGFPTFAWIVLVLAIIWLLNSIAVVNINLPWLPIILIIVSIGWIMDRSKS